LYEKDCTRSTSSIRARLSVLGMLAQRAELMPRGEVFVKRKDQGASAQTNP
jgi:hypothetical protein